MNNSNNQFKSFKNPEAVQAFGEGMEKLGFDGAVSFGSYPHSTTIVVAKYDFVKIIYSFNGEQYACAVSSLQRVVHSAKELLEKVIDSVCCAVEGAKPPADVTVQIKILFDKVKTLAKDIIKTFNL